MARPILRLRLQPFLAIAQPTTPHVCSSALCFRPRFSSTAPSNPSTASSDALSTPPEEPLILVRDILAPGSGHIRVLELNRPKARNAISKGLLAELRREVEDIHAQYTPEGAEVPRQAVDGKGMGPTRALVLGSRVDETFCAGADLKERRLFTPDE
jgi:methylglutaconyl-CoA hydratase